MFLFVERRRSSPSTILDHGHLLFPNVIVWPRYFVLSSFDKISTLMLSISISFLLFELWLLRIWMYFEFHLFCAMLEVAQHFLELLSCRSKLEHIVSKAHIREAVVIVDSKTNTHSLCFCQRGKLSFNAICRTVLKSKLDSGSPCLVLFLYNLFKKLMYSRSIPLVLRASQIELCVMESNAFMKSIVATHIFESFCTSPDDPLPDMCI